MKLTLSISPDLLEKLGLPLRLMRTLRYRAQGYTWWAAYLFAGQDAHRPLFSRGARK
jgi:hypothetical protein